MKNIISGVILISNIEINRNLLRKWKKQIKSNTKLLATCLPLILINSKKRRWRKNNQFTCEWPPMMTFSASSAFPRTWQTSNIPDVTSPGFSFVFSVPLVATFLKCWMNTTKTCFFHWFRSISIRLRKSTKVKVTALEQNRKSDVLSTKKSLINWPDGKNGTTKKTVIKIS